jgi:pimeloyl-ACP methyl ester carboxylesterase
MGYEELVVGVLIALAVLALVVTVVAKVSEWRNPPAGRTLTINGAKVHYLVRGTGEPIVLLHGNATMIEDFVTSGLVERLAQRHKVIVLDRPGFGHSTRPRDEPWPAERQALLIEATLARIGVGPATVVGHSWGTLVALALAAQQPERVRSLVLLSGFYFPEMRFDVMLAAPVATPVVGDILRYTLTPATGLLLMPATLRAMFGPPSVPERFKRQFPVSMMLRPWQIRAAVEDGVMMIPSAASLRPTYRRIRAPTLIMAGSEDRIVDPRRHSRRLQELLPGSRAEILEGDGHMIHHTALDKVAEAIERQAARGVPESREADRLR